MTKLTREQLTQIRQDLLAEIAQVEYLDLSGGRSPRARARESAGYELAQQGFIIRLKKFFGGNRYAISERGKQQLIANPPDQEMSPAQRARQRIRHSNGQYAETYECEVCGKRAVDGIYHSDLIGGAACEDCIKAGKA